MLILFCVFVHVCLCTIFMPGVCRGQKKVLITWYLVRDGCVPSCEWWKLNLELQQEQELSHFSRSTNSILKGQPGSHISSSLVLVFTHHFQPLDISHGTVLHWSQKFLAKVPLMPSVIVKEDPFWVILVFI